MMVKVFSIWELYRADNGSVSIDNFYTWTGHFTVQSSQAPCISQLGSLSSRLSQRRRTPISLLTRTKLFFGPIIKDRSPPTRRRSILRALTLSLGTVIKMAKLSWVSSSTGGLMRLRKNEPGRPFNTGPMLPISNLLKMAQTPMARSLSKGLGDREAGQACLTVIMRKSRPISAPRAGRTRQWAATSWVC